MKRTSHKTIIYDSACPLCTWYTGVFITTGLLPEDGRQSFAEADPLLLSAVDTNRCRNEIPLYDQRTGEVHYGIDALLEIMVPASAFFQLFRKVKALNWIIKRLYKLVSYNRRVIVAQGKNPSGFDCTPDFNLKYRSVLLLLGFIVNTLILFPLQSYVFDQSLFAGSSSLQVQSAHLLLVASNLFVATHLTKTEAYEYLGQVNMLALVAMLLTLPLIIINILFAVPVLVNNLALAGILFFIVKEYFRRMNYAGIVGQHTRVVPFNIFCLILFLVYLSN